jgi:hypothetical protein
VLLAERGELITSQFVVAEADYLILRRLGVDVELGFLEDLAQETYIADTLAPAELATPSRSGPEGSSWDMTGALCSVLSACSARR